MNRAGRTILCSLLFLFVAYVCGYVAYRLRGPIVLHYPRGGGPPGLLVNVETREYKFLSTLFLPCIEVEDCFTRSEKIALFQPNAGPMETFETMRAYAGQFRVQDGTVPFYSFHRFSNTQLAVYGSEDDLKNEFARTAPAGEMLADLRRRLNAPK